MDYSLALAVKIWKMIDDEVLDIPNSGYLRNLTDEQIIVKINSVLKDSPVFARQT